jgi:L-aspartate oxidase
MTEGAGVLRSPTSLDQAAAEVGSVESALARLGPGRVQGELANLVAVGGALLAAARARTETRGAHARRDHPDTRAEWRRRLVLADSGRREP